MKMNIQELKKLIRETIANNSNIDESDLIATPDDWNRAKTQFKDYIITLIQNIENDDYEDAKDIINKTRAILKIWKTKIENGLKNKPEDDYERAFSRFNLDKKAVLGEKNN